MTVVKQLENIKDWLQTEICPNFKFKRPNDDNVDATYQYEKVNPNVFILYVPPEEICKTHRVPSICIQFDDVEEKMTDAGGKLSIKLQFTTFNPGQHSEDGYTRNTEGWRDVWNFVDFIIEKIRNTEQINDLRIVKEDGIKCGPASDNGQIPSYYPYYLAWMTFSVEYGIPSSKKDIKHLL